VPKLTGVDLLLFTVDPGWGADVVAAGAAGIVVDWERRGKHRRQLGEGTQINGDTPADLSRMRAATDGRLICRINGFGPWTPAEVDDAVARGADELLLPMVRTPEQVDRTLEAVAGRCGLGILVETQDGVARAAELARRPLSRVYVGLNDLRIDRGSDQLFTPARRRHGGRRPRGGARAVRCGWTDAARGRRAGAGLAARRRAGPLRRRLHLPAAVVHRRHGRARPLRRGARLLAVLTGLATATAPEVAERRAAFVAAVTGVPVAQPA
jgi:hypothetical protein